MGCEELGTVGYLCMIPYSDAEWEQAERDREMFFTEEDGFEEWLDLGGEG